MYNDYTLANYLTNSFEKEKSEIRKSAIETTGFKNLDNLNGFLKSELYILAGAPSIGKSTFALQLAIQVARQKRHVLYIALEQSKVELTAKCLINAYTFQHLNEKRKLVDNPLYSASNYIYNDKFSVNGFSVDILNDFSKFLIIWDGGNSVNSISQIKNFIDENLKDIKLSLIIVDYLQILSPCDNYASQLTDKQRIDMVVQGLQNEIQGKYQVPVIAISSVNRSSYTSPLDLQSLKESGGLEYGCDVVWTLQPNIVFNFNDKNSDARKEMLREDEKLSSDGSRLMRLECIKNRMGQKSDICFFSYYPKLEFFEETSQLTSKIAGTTKKTQVKRQNDMYHHPI